MLDVFPLKYDYRGQHSSRCAYALNNGHPLPIFSSYDVGTLRFRRSDDGLVRTGSEGVAGFVHIIDISTFDFVVRKQRQQVRKPLQYV
jgi:hypothetical protein